MPAIAVEALTKTFGDHNAVDGISFAVEEGRTLALLGGNGAGKTTTLAMILGLVKPTRGSIRVLGVDATRFGPRARACMNFQSPYVDLPRRLTVRENLAVYARLYGVPKVRRAVEQVCERLGLSDFLDRKTGSLSAGQGTRVGLAKALINTPRVLLLDEPTASLDPDTADWVRTTLQAYQAEHAAAIVLASHNMGEVERLADDVMMMRAGQSVDRGAPGALITRYGRSNLEEVFLDVARGQTEPAAEADA